MKKYLTLPFSFLVYLLLTPVYALADNSAKVCPTGAFGTLCISNTQTSTIIGNAFNLIVIVAVLIATAYLIYGGIKWAMSRGDKAEVEAARNHIVASIVGLIVVFLAFFIINVILNLFGINSTNPFTFPTLLQ